MAQVANIQPPVDAEKRKRTRSPAYPYINLETAIIRAKEFFDKEQRNAANVNVAMTHWGFVAGSSNGAQTVATLTSFGLLQDEGIGDKRKVRLTQNALRILLGTDPKERAELIKQAALAPKIHQQLWESGSNSSSDAQLRHTLLLDWPIPFNENAVDGFIREYRDTIAFAKLAESDKVSSEVKDNGSDEASKPPYVPKIGDWVQWEHKGVLGLPKAERIKGFAPGGEYAYVESQHGAVLTSELIPAEAPSSNPSNPPEASTQQRMALPLKTHMLEFVVPLSGGSKAVFQWPSALSEEDKADLQDSLKIVERKILRAEKAEQSLETFGIASGVAPGS